MENVTCVDPETGEIIELNDENLDYIDQIIQYYMHQTNSHIEVLKRVAINLTALSLAKQERDKLLDSVKLQLME